MPQAEQLLHLVGLGGLLTTLEGERQVQMGQQLTRNALGVQAVRLPPSTIAGAFRGPIWADATGDHLGREAARRLGHQLAVEDQDHLLGTPNIQVVADHALEEGAAGLGTLEDPCVGDRELAEGSS